MSAPIGLPSIIRGARGRDIDELGLGTVDRSGAADMAPLINDAIEWCAEAGDPLWISPGLYRQSSSIYLQDYAHVLLSEDAVLRRDFSTVGVAGHITQQDIYTALKEVRWSGGRIECSDPAGLTGNAFALHINDSQIAHFHIADWPDNGRAFLLYGNRCRLHNFDALSTYDGGGIRLDGCKDFLVENFRVYCGDDCLIFAANANAESALSGMDTERCIYVGGIARSWNARPTVSTMERVGLEPGITNSIRDNAFIGIRGYGRRATRANNTLSSGSIERIFHIGCHYDCSDDATGGDEAISIDADAGSYGPVRDIVFQGCTVLAPYLSAVSIGGDAAGVRFERCHFDAPRTARETIRVNENGEAFFTGCTFETRDDTNTVKVGADASSGARAFFDGGEFRDIADTYNGINYISAAAGRVNGVRFREAAGATTASAIVVGGDCNNVVVGENDYSGITDLAKVVWTPDDNSGCRVDAPNILTISANTTTRAHASGTIYLQTSAGSRTLTLPAAQTGLEYTMVQEGAGAAVVRAAGSDTIRIPGGVSSAGGTITSSAQGDFVRVRAVAGKWVAVAVGGTWTPA